jgi:hypothetical protein
MPASRFRRVRAVEEAGRLFSTPSRPALRATTRWPPGNRPHPPHSQVEPPGRTTLCSAAAGMTHVGMAAERCRMQRPSQAATPRSRPAGDQVNRKVPP